MIVVGFHQTNNNGRLTNLPLFTHIKIVFLSPQIDRYINEGVNDDFALIKASYIQPTVVLDNLVTPYGGAIKINRNPSLIELPVSTLQVTGLDISGNSPLQITLLQ